jgi:predicted transcriptional regulator
MARRFRMRELEQQHGDLEELIPKLLNESDGSQKTVAEKLNVSQATISQWLSKNGYVARVRYEKQRQTA